LDYSDLAYHINIEYDDLARYIDLDTNEIADQLTERLKFSVTKR
jgi:hypothetical protein